MVSLPHKPVVEIPSSIISSQDLGWESIIVEEFQQPPGAKESCFWKEHAICLSLATRPNRLWQTIGDRSYVGLYRKGDISITPAELPCSYRAYNNDHYLQIRIPPQFVRKVVTETVDSDPDLKLTTEFRCRNPQIEQLAMMLRTELHQGGDGFGQLYIESLANAMVVHLLRDYSETKTRVSVHKGGLDDRKLVQVSEYINAYLDRDIKLADLASVAGVSQFHFSRLFKQSVGITPHKYLLKERVERAKHLLKNSKLAIAEIALQCGFNSQSHLGKSFREFTGVTPSSYRRS